MLCNNKSVKKERFKRTKAHLADLTSTARNDATTGKVVLNNLTKEVRSRIFYFLKNRTKKDSDFLEEDFNNLLKVWGIKEHQIPKVLKDFQLQFLLYLFLLVISILCLLQQYVFISFLIFFSSLIGIYITLWRYKILLKRQYRPFPCSSILYRLIKLD